MEKGVEVMITLRELSKNDGYMFTWQDALRAYSAVYGKHYWESAARREPGGRIATYIREHRHVVMTTYNLLRGQLKGGTLVRLDKGVYVFKDLASQLTEPAVSDDRVVIDGLIVTSQGPGTAIDFALTLIRLAQGVAEAEAVARGLVL